MGGRDLWEAVRYSDPVIRFGRHRIGWVRRVVEMTVMAGAWSALVHGLLGLGPWREPGPASILAMILLLGISSLVSIFWVISVIRLLRPSGRMLGVVVLVLFFAAIGGVSGTPAAGGHVTGRTAQCRMLSVEPEPGRWLYRVRCPGEASVLTVVRAERDDAVVARPLRYHPGRSPRAVPAEADGAVWLVRLWLAAVGIVGAASALALPVGLVRVARGRPGWDADHEL